MHLRKFHVFRAPDDGGAAGGVPAPGPAPAAPAPAPGPAPGPAPAPGNALAAGGGGGAGSPAPAPSPGAPAPAPAAPGPFGTIPEKFHVKGADGSPDLPATWAKVEEHRANLERRLGSGDIRPTAATDYKVNVPEALADKIDAAELAKSPDVQAFLGKLHEAGASQKVVDAAMAEMLDRGIKLRSAMPVLAEADCVAALKQRDGWKTDDEYSRQVARAYQAGKAYAGADFDGILADYGNDPRIVAMLAAIGAELQEDTQPSAEAAAQIQENLDALMADPAYLNAADPKHAGIKAKVDALTAKLTGTRPVAQGRTMSFKAIV